MLQVFKFIYSCRLAELGLATQAFHYCEVIAKSILAQPHQYSLVLVSQLAQVCASSWALSHGASGASGFLALGAWLHRGECMPRAVGPGLLDRMSLACPRAGVLCRCAGASRHTAPRQLHGTKAPSRRGL